MILTPINALLEVTKIETEAGFSLIKLDEVRIIEGYDKILHIIDPTEIKQALTKIETDIEYVFQSPKDDDNIMQ